jgi:hypothetical protein
VSGLEAAARHWRQRVDSGPTRALRRLARCRPSLPEPLPDAGNGTRLLGGVLGCTNSRRCTSGGGEMTRSEAINASSNDIAAAFPPANPMKSVLPANLNEQCPPRAEICTLLQYHVLESN